MKSTLILSAVVTAFLFSSIGNAAAQDRHARKAAALDRKGDKIEARLDRRADRLDARGKHCKAAKLRLKGDRINAKLDKRAERIRQRS